jgi:hypothetical protein
MKVNRLAPLLTFLTLAACGYRPARFSTAPARWSAGDETPIEIPERRNPSKELYYIEAYGERAIVSPLEVSRPPLGVDVNRYDEVVRSSWFRGNVGRPLAGYESDGPPALPLIAVAGDPAIPGAIAVEDARGLHYELLFDVPGHPEARTAAVAIASRLVHALGYRTPEAHVIEHEGARAVAIRWPAEADLGPTPILWTRPDDPNDVLPHIHRRTLRASLVFALWLGLDDIREHTFRDAYVGTASRGFVRHYFVGLEDALGTDSLSPDGLAPNPQEDGSSASLLFVSFGFTAKGDPRPRALPFRGVARFAPEVELDAGGFQPPFPPHQRLRPDDAYWAGKTMAAVDDATLGDALTAGKLSDPRAIHYLARALDLRREALLGTIYAAVTPCDALRVRERDGVVRVLLVDRALEAGVTKTPRRYRVEVIDDEGTPLLPPRRVRFDSPLHTVRLPARALGDYAVVRVTPIADGVRPADFHIGRARGKLRLLGVEH